MNLVSSPVLPAMREPTPAVPLAPRDTSSTPTIIHVQPYPPTHPTVDKIAEPAVVLVVALSALIVLPDSSLPTDTVCFVLKPAASAPSTRTP